MRELLLGKSVKGKKIIGYSFGDDKCFNKTLIIGCIHGIETQSKDTCEIYLNEIKNNSFYEDAYLLLIPALNPDGYELKTRTNANGVDLNRNFPSSTWSYKNVIKNTPINPDENPYYPGEKPSSEPETKIIVDLLSKYNFKKIIAVHTNYTFQNPNPPMINFDGEQSRELAEKMGHVSSLMVHGDIGYPTPGALGGWIGNELKKISITIEFDHTKSSDELYKKHGKCFEVAVLS